MVNGKNSILARHKFDYSRLRELIREQFGTEKAFAEAMKMEPTNLSHRFRLCSFTISEINRVCALLSIAEKDIPTFFFTKLE